MPAFTANRGYPYSVPGDNNDIPQALEDFANAVDTDVQALYDAIPQGRPVARVRGTTPITFPAGGTVDRQLTWEEVQLNSGGCIDPIAPGAVSIVPSTAGFYMILGVVTYGPSSQVITTELILSKGTPIIAANVLTRQSAQVTVTTSDGVRNLMCMSGAFFNGTTDFIQLTGRINKVAASTYTLAERSLTLFRMTTS